MSHPFLYQQQTQTGSKGSSVKYVIRLGEGGFVKKSPGHKNKGTPSRGSTRGPNIIVIGGNQVVIFIQITFGSDFKDF